MSRQIEDLLLRGIATFKTAEERIRACEDLLLSGMDKEVEVRFSGGGNPRGFEEARIENCGKTVAIRGRISEMDSAKPYPFSMTFECRTCSGTLVFRTEFPGKTANPRPYCCKKPLEVTSVRWRMIRKALLESPDEERTVTAFLPHDGSLPNLEEMEEFVFAGELMLSWENLAKQRTTLSLKVSSVGSATEDEAPLEVARELKEIVSSFCPQIEGCFLEKISLLLTMVSDPYDSSLRLRVLIVGDPGVGKSTLMRECSEILSGASVYCTGEVMSSAGLTSAAVGRRMERASLDYGIFALSDGKFLLLDEYDKASPETKETFLRYFCREEIWICKSNIHSKVLKRSSVVVSANPTGGIFSSEIRREQQIPVPAQQLGKFDVVLMMEDSTDVEEKYLGYLRSTLGIRTDRSDLPMSLTELRNYLKWCRTVGPIEIDWNLVEEAIGTVETERRESFGRILRLLNRLTGRRDPDYSLVRIADTLCFRKELTAQESFSEGIRKERFRSETDFIKFEVAYLLKMRGPMKRKSLQLEMPHYSKERISEGIARGIDEGIFLQIGEEVEGEDLIMEKN